MKLQVSNTNAPTWRDITIHAHLPEKLKSLETMAKNLLTNIPSDARSLNISSSLISGSFFDSSISL